MSTIITKFANNQLNIVRCSKKNLLILSKMISFNKNVPNYSKIKRCFEEVFSSDDVEIKQENCYVFSVYINKVKSDYYLLKIDENKPYVYYLNNENKLVLFEDDASTYVKYFQETNYQVFKYCTN